MTFPHVVTSTSLREEETGYLSLLLEMQTAGYNCVTFPSSCEVLPRVGESIILLHTYLHRSSCYPLYKSVHVSAAITTKCRVSTLEEYRTEQDNVGRGGPVRNLSSADSDFTD